MKTLAIVVPCYNEEETIHPFLEACQAVERQMANQLAFSYYFVNDGSKDRTLEVLRQVSKQFEMFTISLSLVILGRKQAYWQDLKQPKVTTSQLWMPIFKIHLNCSSRCMPKSKKVTTLSGHDVQTARVSHLFVHSLLRPSIG